MKFADAKTSRMLNATDPDLTPFHRRGGKLILYHGWSDAAIAAPNAINYYKSVVAKMGVAQTAEFVRLFMVPDMQHCGGGAGPNNFGQLSVAAGDADHDIDTALELWVTGGPAPERVIAAKHQVDQDAKSPVVRTGLLCAYPLVARYKGTGGTDDAANYICDHSASSKP
jgi:feruloyl esterase